MNFGAGGDRDNSSNGRAGGLNNDSTNISMDGKESLSILQGIGSSNKKKELDPISPNLLGGGAKKSKLPLTLSSPNVKKSKL